MGKKKPAKSRARDEFIAAVRSRMAARGMTQGELAEKLGVSRPVVARLLSGSYHPGLDVVERVAKALDCELQLKFSCKK